jgi:hypothetical protein
MKNQVYGTHCLWYSPPLIPLLKEEGRHLFLLLAEILKSVAERKIKFMVLITTALSNLPFPLRKR